MNPVAILTAVAAILFLLFLGIPIGFVFIIVGLVGGIFYIGLPASLSLMGSTFYDTSGNIGLASLSLYILMGYFASNFRFGDDLYATANAWLGKIRGGLAFTTIGGCTAFATLTGSGMGGTVTFGTLAWPQMRKYGYSPRLGLGVIAAAGTLGSMIPPSTGLILLGLLTELSIGKLFIAGILPGVLEAVTYTLLVLTWVKLRPESAPLVEFSITWRERFVILLRLVGPALIAVTVLGGIYSGFFTATESAAVGAFSVFVLGLIMKRVTWKGLINSFVGALKVTGMIYLIIMGVFYFTNYASLTGFIEQITKWVQGANLHPMVLLSMILFLYLPLGMIMDGAGMKVLTMPFVYPLVIGAGFNGIHFCILVQRMTEVGLITPPVGLGAFALKGVAPEAHMNDIWLGLTPFFFADLINVAILAAFPVITLFLPNMMRGF
ncbi:MAG: TRAP transporter large permease [Chloroflexi bacterium]|nr:TRAP transporter large permease [Chloroflexota bacterium]